MNGKGVKGRKRGKYRKQYLGSFAQRRQAAKRAEAAKVEFQRALLFPLPSVLIPVQAFSSHPHHDLPEELPAQ